MSYGTLQRRVRVFSGRIGLPYTMRALLNIEQTDNISLAMQQQPDGLLALVITKQATSAEDMATVFSGRVFIPMEMRNVLGIEKNDYVTLAMQPVPHEPPSIVVTKAFVENQKAVE